MAETIFCVIVALTVGIAIMLLLTLIKKKCKEYIRRKGDD